MITVLGSINLDLVARAPRLPALGETVLGSAFLTAAGGKGANQAVAARRAGAEVRMVGAVGNDDFAPLATVPMREAGVDLVLVRATGEPTGIAVILVDGNGDNMITVVPGANGALGPADVHAALAPMAPGDLLMLQLETPMALVGLALTEATRRGVTSILNIAPFTREAVPLTHLADIVIGNRLECAELAGSPASGIDELREALLRLGRERGRSLVATLGEHGALAVRDGQAFTAEGLAIEPIDTVGAGDTFCGYFAAGLDRGLSFPDALARAVAAGSLACLKQGAQTAIPMAVEVDHAMRSRAPTA